MLFGTKAWHWMRSGGARSSGGRVPIGQRKSVQWSVGSKILRVDREGLVVEGDAEEVILEEDETRLESGEVEG